MATVVEATCDVCLVQALTYSLDPPAGWYRLITRSQLTPNSVSFVADLCNGCGTHVARGVHDTVMASIKERDEARAALKAVKKGSG